MSAARRKSLGRPDWGEYGPCMRALPSDRWRAFVEHLVLSAGEHGAQAAAARKAGFGTARSRPLTMAQIGSRLARDERVLAAVAEESRKVLRLGAPAAARALIKLVEDPTHKGHERAVMALVDHIDPTTTTHNLNVTHRALDADEEAVEELRALRELGTPRAKLLELFGPNGLERLEAQELVRRSDEARVINAIPEAIDGPA
jgi:phage terminase small subunit